MAYNLTKIIIHILYISKIRLTTYKKQRNILFSTKVYGYYTEYFTIYSTLTAVNMYFMLELNFHGRQHNKLYKYVCTI